MKAIAMKRRFEFLKSGSATITKIAGGTLAFSLLVSLVLNASVGEARPLDPITRADQASRLADLVYTPYATRAGLPAGNIDGDCEHSTTKVVVMDPVTQIGREVSLPVYRPVQDGVVVNKSPIVVVVPTLNGVTVVEPRAASQLCSNGIAAVIADVIDTSLPATMPGAGHEDKHNRDAILAIRTILDYLGKQPQFDSNRMGIIGFSLGGIMTSMIAGVEADRLKAVVITVGGGNIPYIMSTTDQDKIQSLREQRMSFMNMTEPTQYEDWLRPLVKFDPLAFSSLAHGDRIMMVTAKSDTKVPYIMQQGLAKAFGNPVISEYSGGHVQTILSLVYFYFGDVTSFFKTKFGMPNFAPLPHHTYRHSDLD